MSVSPKTALLSTTTSGSFNEKDETTKYFRAVSSIGKYTFPASIF